MILIFKSIEPLQLTLGRIIYLFVYVKIEKDIVSIKSDMTKLEYISVKDFMLKNKPKEIQTLIEFDKKVKDMDNKERRSYLEKEFKQMGYRLMGVLYAAEERNNSTTTEEPQGKKG